MARYQRYSINEPLTLRAIKALTVRWEETSKQVSSNVTDRIEKARQASTCRKQQPFVWGTERIDRQTVNIHMDKLVHILEATAPLSTSPLLTQLFRWPDFHCQIWWLRFLTSRKKNPWSQLSKFFCKDCSCMKRFSYYSIIVFVFTGNDFWVRASGEVTS